MCGFSTGNSFVPDRTFDTIWKHFWLYNHGIKGLLVFTTEIEKKWLHTLCAIQDTLYNRKKFLSMVYISFKSHDLHGTESSLFNYIVHKLITLLHFKEQLKICINYLHMWKTSLSPEDWSWYLVVREASQNEYTNTTVPIEEKLLWWPFYNFCFIYFSRQLPKSWNFSAIVMWKSIQNNLKS